MPIKSITLKSGKDKFTYLESSGGAGPACLRLLTTLKGIQLGKIPDQFGWCEKVEKPDGPIEGDPVVDDARNAADGSVDSLP